MVEHKIASLKELYDFDRSTWTGHFIFRGEDSTSYSLRPKFGRAVVKGKYTKASHEKSIFENFKREAYPHLASIPRDDWEWLAIAQHHGLATRLLDWTTNPLVAAYFASHTTSNDDAVIYAIDGERLPKVSLETSPFAIKKDSVFHPLHATARIVAQAGLFTVHSNPEAIFDHPDLHRLILKTDMLVELMVVLRRFGLHRSSLFPGLDSVAFHMNDSYGCDD